MARGTTQFAVALLLLVAGAGVPALAAVDAPDGATGEATTAAVAPLDETDDTITNSIGDTTNTTDDTTNTTDDTTNSTDNTTDDATNTTNETLTNTTDDTTNTTDDTTNATENETDDTINTTNETLTNTTEDTTNTTDETNVTDDVANTTDEVTDEATNATDGVTNATGEVTDAATDTVDAVSTAHFSFATSSSLVDTATGTLDVTTRDESGADGGSPSSSNGDGTGTTTASDATTAAGDSATGASGANDRTPDRDERGIPASGSEMVVGMSALTAAALVPQLADALALVGNVGGLLSASSAFAGSTSRGRPRRAGGLRSRLDRFWRFVTPFRYSRWDDSDPLDHEVREALYETVERTPGAYLSEVCDRADVALSTARHHLDVLEDEGLVTTAKVRGKRRYYPDHAPDVELTAALEDDGTGEVLHALARLGASHGGRLADELDRDASTVSHHLSRLEDAGLVEREREGRAVVNRLAPEVRAVLRGDGDADRDTDAETPAVAD